MIELLYYIGEILQETWWIILIMGFAFCIFMTISPDEEEWESLDDYYNHNPFKENTEVDLIDGHKPNLKDND